MTTQIDLAASEPSKNMLDIDMVQVADDLSTVWVHGYDGSTVGRFSVRFGIDIHRTATDQIEGAPQCLHCTHEAPSHHDWLTFCDLMQKLRNISVPVEILGTEQFKQTPQYRPSRER